MPSGNVTVNPGPNDRHLRRPPFWRTVRGGAALAAATAVAVFLVGWAGYGIRAATHPDKAVTVTATFHGTVDLVSQKGDAGCVQADSHGQRVCSVFYVIGGKTLHVGDKVNAAHEWVPSTGGGKSDLLLVYTDTDS